jgi:GT2 family glycosyltransferase
MVAKFLITLVAFKSTAFAKLAVESVLKRTKPESFKLVIIDNGSNNATTELFKSYQNHPNVHVIINSENIGFPAAVNQGIDYFFTHKEYDYFTTMHSDTVCCSQDWNEKLLKVFEADSKIQCLGPMSTNQDEGQFMYGEIYQAMRNHTVDTYNIKRLQNAPAEVERIFNSLYFNDVDARVAYIEARLGHIKAFGCDNSFLTFSRNLVEKVGYFDEAFFPGMGEDSDYVNRMRALGYETHRTGTVYSHHWCSITYFGAMDGRQVHDRAIGRLATKKTYDQQCLRFSCKNCNNDGVCSLDICNNVCLVGVVCDKYEYNPAYNKVNETFFPVR